VQRVITLLTRKLETIGAVPADARECIEELATLARIKEFATAHDLVSEFDRPHVCTMLLSGFVCRYKVVPDGRRQIMSFHIPGDIPDLQSLFLKTMDHSVGTLVPTQVALFAHTDVLRLLKRCPELNHLCWRDTLIDAAVFREWMVGIGRRKAYARIAHLLCELMVRMRAMGFASGPEYELPITQTDIGDALGLSNVHVSRTLGELRRSKLLAFRPGAVTVLDWDGLAQAGEFDPTYLHFDTDVAA